MFNEVVTDTNIVYYLMIAVGVVGVLAKAVNQITLRRMVRAAGNMSKSTHKLIKLVRAKYEHALMLHDRVENAEAFVEKYIYEYRGFLLRIHTWRQLEVQSVWFSGILAAFGGVIWYMENGFCEEMYRYISLGAAEMVLLFVVSQLSDEQYKIEAAENYMVDYLENVCAMRRRKARQSEKEQIDVIRTENSQANGMDMEENEFAAGMESAAGNGAVKGRNFSGGSRGTAARKPAYGKADAEAAPEGSGLSISIEGEPRRARTGVSDDTAPMYEAAEVLAMAAEKDYGYGEADGKPYVRGEAARRGADNPGYSEAAERREGTLHYDGAARPEKVSSNYGKNARKAEAAPGHAASAGRGVSTSGQAAGGSQMKRIPGRFQDVVQRMIEDTSEYEEVLEGPVLPDDAPRSAGRPDRMRADRKKGDAARQVIRRTVKGNPEVSEREGSNLKEEAIRQILEEFLA